MYIDLLQIQRFSFLKFLKNGINQVFENVNPLFVANQKYIFYSKYYLVKIPSQINFNLPFDNNQTSPVLSPIEFSFQASQSLEKKKKKENIPPIKRSGASIESRSPFRISYETEDNLFPNEKEYLGQNGSKNLQNKRDVTTSWEKKTRVKKKRIENKNNSTFSFELDTGLSFVPCYSYNSLFINQSELFNFFLQVNKQQKILATTLTKFTMTNKWYPRNYKKTWKKFIFYKNFSRESLNRLKDDSRTPDVKTNFTFSYKGILPSALNYRKNVSIKDLGTKKKFLLLKKNYLKKEFPNGSRSKWSIFFHRTFYSLIPRSFFSKKSEELKKPINSKNTLSNYLSEYSSEFFLQSLSPVLFHFSDLSEKLKKRTDREIEKQRLTAGTKREVISSFSFYFFSSAVLTLLDNQILPTVSFQTKRESKKAKIEKKKGTQTIKRISEQRLISTRNEKNLFFKHPIYRPKTLEQTKINQSDKVNRQDSSYQNLTYSSEFFLPVQIIDQISKKMHLSWFLLVDLLIQTKRGHFIVNGYPKTIVHQILRSPGIRFKNTNNKILADIISVRGAWMGIQIIYEKMTASQQLSSIRLSKQDETRSEKNKISWFRKKYRKTAFDDVKEQFILDYENKKTLQKAKKKIRYKINIEKKKYLEAITEEEEKEDQDNIKKIDQNYKEYGFTYLDNKSLLSQQTSSDLLSTQILSLNSSPTSSFPFATLKENNYGNGLEDETFKDEYLENNEFEHKFLENEEFQDTYRTFHSNLYLLSNRHRIQNKISKNQKQSQDENLEKYAYLLELKQAFVSNSPKSVSVPVDNNSLSRSGIANSEASQKEKSDEEIVVTSQYISSTKESLYGSGREIQKEWEKEKIEKNYQSGGLSEAKKLNALNILTPFSDISSNSLNSRVFPILRKNDETAKDLEKEETIDLMPYSSWVNEEVVDQKYLYLYKGKIKRAIKEKKYEIFKRDLKHLLINSIKKNSKNTNRWFKIAYQTLLNKNRAQYLFPTNLFFSSSDSNSMFHFVSIFSKPTYHSLRFLIPKFPPTFGLGSDILSSRIDNKIIENPSFRRNERKTEVSFFMTEAKRELSKKGTNKKWPTFFSPFASFENTRPKNEIKQNKQQSGLIITDQVLTEQNQSFFKIPYDNTNKKFPVLENETIHETLFILFFISSPFSKLKRGEKQEKKEKLKISGFSFLSYLFDHPYFLYNNFIKFWEPFSQISFQNPFNNANNHNQNFYPKHFTEQFWQFQQKKNKSFLYHNIKKMNPIYPSPNSKIWSFFSGRFSHRQLFNYESPQFTYGNKNKWINSNFVNISFDNNLKKKKQKQNITTELETSIDQNFWMNNKTIQLNHKIVNFSPFFSPELPFLKNKIEKNLKKTPKSINQEQSDKENIFAIKNNFQPYFLENTQKKLFSLYQSKEKLISILNISHFRNILYERFFNPKYYDIGFMGRKHLNKKLRLNIPAQCTTLTSLDFLAIFYKLFSFHYIVNSSFPLNQIGLSLLPSLEKKNVKNLQGSLALTYVRVVNYN